MENKKMEKERPSIFDYAKKELTQDALICWLMDCCRYNGGYKELGRHFISEFVFGGDCSEFEVLDGFPKKQYRKIDVFALIRTGDTIHPVIVENKTNTFLHNGQFQNYCVKIADDMQEVSDATSKKKRFGICTAAVAKKIRSGEYKWGPIKYILFKSGYLYGKNVHDYEKERAALAAELRGREQTVEDHIVTIGEMIEILAPHEGTDAFVAEYLRYCREIHEKDQKILQNWDSDNWEEKQESLASRIGQVAYLNYVFGADHDNYEFPSKGNGHYTEYNLCQTAKARFAICFISRSNKATKKRKKSMYALVFCHYPVMEDKIVPAWNRELFDSVSRETGQIIDTLFARNKYDLKKPELEPYPKKDQQFNKHFQVFTDENTAEVKRFFNDFAAALKDSPIFADGIK